MASDFRCLLLSTENAPFDEFIFSIKFCEIFQGFTKNVQGFSRVSRDFHGFEIFPGFSGISRARTNPVSSEIARNTSKISLKFCLYEKRCGRLLLFKNSVQLLKSYQSVGKSTSRNLQKGGYHAAMTCVNF